MNGEAALWRDDDPEVFRDTILAAAERLGVQPLAVEKDYWVCEALRSITTAHRDEIVFKGGTSLEKLRIIRRFSEDLDLLVIGQYPSKNAEQRALRNILASAAAATGAEPSDVTAGGNSGAFHRAGYLNPPLEHHRPSMTCSLRCTPSPSSSALPSVDPPPSGANRSRISAVTGFSLVAVTWMRMYPPCMSR